MHFAAWQNHGAVLRLLLDAGGDPSIHDTRHDSDVMGWAEYGQKPEMVRILKEYAARS
jgi:hypothetical protein